MPRRTWQSREGRKIHQPLITGQSILNQELQQMHMGNMRMTRAKKNDLIRDVSERFIMPTTLVWVKDKKNVGRQRNKKEQRPKELPWANLCKYLGHLKIGKHNSHCVHGTTQAQKAFISIPKVVAPGSTQSNLILNLMFFPQLWPVFIPGSSTEFPDVSSTLSPRRLFPLSRDTAVHISLQPVSTSHFKPSVHVSEGEESVPYLCLLLLIPITKIPQRKWPC